MEMPIRVWASLRTPAIILSQMHQEFCRTKELNLLTLSVCRKKWQKQIQQLLMSDMSPELLAVYIRRGSSRCLLLSRTADSPAVCKMTQEANSREIRKWLTNRIAEIFRRLVELTLVHEAAKISVRGVLLAEPRLPPPRMHLFRALLKGRASPKERIPLQSAETKILRHSAKIWLILHSLSLTINRKLRILFTTCPWMTAPNRSRERSVKLGDEAKPPMNNHTTILLITLLRPMTKTSWRRNKVSWILLVIIHNKIMRSPRS